MNFFDSRIQPGHENVIEFPASSRRRPSNEADHYQMIDTVTLRHFRSFRELRLEDCRRINVVVGENGSGKTALLEGIFLAAGGSPEVALRLRQWRGASSQSAYQGTRSQVDRALWGEFFYGNDIDKPALVDLKGRGSYSRSVTMSFKEAVKLSPVSKSRGFTPDGSSPISFKYKHPGGIFSVTPEYTENGIQFPPLPESNIEATFYASNQPVNLYEIASRFSELSKKHEQESFLEAFRLHFPRIVDLSIESIGGQAAIFATVEDLPIKIPLSNVSSGMSKLAALLLSMHVQPRGVLIVDEIENGFYFKKFPLLWETLYDFAMIYESQIFVTTHSGECLDAAAQVAERHPNDFCLFRTVSRRGQTEARRISGSSFVQAAENSVEIR